VPFLGLVGNSGQGLVGSSGQQVVDPAVEIEMGNC